MKRELIALEELKEECKRSFIHQSDDVYRISKEGRMFLHLVDIESNVWLMRDCNKQILANLYYKDGHIAWVYWNDFEYLFISTEMFKEIINEHVKVESDRVDVINSFKNIREHEVKFLSNRIGLLDLMLKIQLKLNKIKS